MSSAVFELRRGWPGMVISLMRIKKNVIMQADGAQSPIIKK
jgi:hypothetical protein